MLGNEVFDAGAKETLQITRSSDGVTHGLACCTLSRDLHETLARRYSTNMEPIETALAALKLQDKKNISACAKLYGVDRSTLSRRFNGVSNLAKVKHQKQQLLKPQQEKDLIKYINKLIERGIPPTTAIVRNFAREIAGKRPGECWS